MNRLFLCFARIETQKLGAFRENFSRGCNDTNIMRSGNGVILSAAHKNQTGSFKQVFWSYDINLEKFITQNGGTSN